MLHYPHFPGSLTCTFSLVQSFIYFYLTFALSYHFYFLISSLFALSPSLLFFYSLTFTRPLQLLPPFPSLSLVLWSEGIVVHMMVVHPFPERHSIKQPCTSSHVFSFTTTTFRPQRLFLTVHSYTLLCLFIVVCVEVTSHISHLSSSDPDVVIRNFWG